MRITQIAVNQNFADEVGPEGVRAYVEAIVAAESGARGRTHTEVTELLTQALAERGVAVPDIEIGRAAEQLADPEVGELVIIGPGGETLHGTPPSTESDVAQQAEPEDSERPFYS